MGLEDFPAEIGVGEHCVGGDDRPSQRQQSQQFEGRLVLIGLAVDSPLGQGDLGFMRLASYQVDRGQLFAGRATQAFAVDGDRAPTMPVGQSLKPSADNRLEGVDVDGTEDLRERALGKRLGPHEAEGSDHVWWQVSAEIDNTLESAHPSEHR